MPLIVTSNGNLHFRGLPECLHRACVAQLCSVCVLSDKQLLLREPESVHLIGRLRLCSRNGRILDAIRLCQTLVLRRIANSHVELFGSSRKCHQLTKPATCIDPSGPRQHTTITTIVVSVLQRITQCKLIAGQATNWPQSQGQDSVTTVILEGAAWCASQCLAAFLL